MSDPQSWPDKTTIGMLRIELTQNLTQNRKQKVKKTKQTISAAVHHWIHQTPGNFLNVNKQDDDWSVSTEELLNSKSETPS